MGHPATQNKGVVAEALRPLVLAEHTAIVALCVLRLGRDGENEL